MPPRLRRLSDYVTWYAAATPLHEASVFGGERLTYPQLDRRIDDCARAMRAHGVSEGDRVAMLSTPRPEYLIVFLAADRIGATWFGLNPVYQFEECATLIEDAAPKLLFGFARLRGRDKTELLVRLKRANPCIEHLICWDDDLGGAALTYDRFAPQTPASQTPPPKAPPEAAPSRESVPLIVYTSGSTGKPKGTLLTNQGLVEGGRHQFEIWPCSPLRAICNLPINHVGCNGDIVAYAVVGGGTLVFQEKFDADRALDLIEAERITWILGVPTMFQAMLDANRTNPRDCTSLQVAYFAGAPMPRAAIAELRGLCANVFTGWGMSETTVAATYSAPGDDDETLATTVGKPSAVVDIAVLDENGEPRTDGEAGELVARGPIVTPGYYRRADATDEAFDRNGWFHTGDIAYIRPDWRLRIVGRMKEMFKSGGYNVYPREIEAVLERHPKVKAAVVVPIPDNRFQEVGMAYVLVDSDTDATEAQYAAFCREHLAGYKVPKLFRLRTSLPMVDVGKIDRVALKREALTIAERNRDDER